MKGGRGRGAGREQENIILMYTYIERGGGRRWREKFHFNVRVHAYMNTYVHIQTCIHTYIHVFACTQIFLLERERCRKEEISKRVLDHEMQQEVLRLAEKEVTSYVQCVAVCCSVLQCVKVCCSVLQCVV